MNPDYNLLNTNYINNDNGPKEVVIFKNENSQSIFTFPDEKGDRYNIIIKDSLDFKTNIIIPPSKEVRNLFEIYKRNRNDKDNSKDEILFSYNGTLNINNDKNKKISEVFRNYSVLNTINKK